MAADGDIIRAITDETEDKLDMAYVYSEWKRNRRPHLMDALLDVWERSVKETHLFLTSEQVAAIKEYVPQALGSVEHLIVATEEATSADAGMPVAFMGIEDDRLEMLFIAPEERGRGLGKRLLQLGIERYGIRELTVNEQNPQAVGFYEHMGFTTYKRTELDEEGNPYPLLYMKWQSDGVLR